MSAFLMAKLLVTTAVPVGGLAYLERLAFNRYSTLIPTDFLSTILAPIKFGFSGLTPLAVNTFEVPKAYGLVILVNVVGSALLLFGLGMQVVKARKEYGVSYPDLYATGTDVKSKTFNCIQRGHQNAMETYPQFLALSLIAGLRHPLTTSAVGALWLVSRYCYMQCYATGDVEARYKHPLANQHFRALLGVMCLAISTTAGVMNIF